MNLASNGPGIVRNLCHVNTKCRDNQPRAMTISVEGDNNVEEEKWSRAEEKDLANMIAHGIGIVDTC